MVWGLHQPEVEALHAEGYSRIHGSRDWKAQVERHSLGWVCARRGAELAGFVNGAWDGGAHAFILDTAHSCGKQGRKCAVPLAAWYVTSPADRHRERCGKFRPT